MTKLQNKEAVFAECPIPEAIFRLALPTVAGQMILVVYNLADTFFIGLTGNDAMLTAVTVCMPAFMILSAVANLFGVGGASVIARELGKGRREKAGYAASFAFWGCALTALTYSLLVSCLADWFINLLGGAHPEVHAYAKSYLLCTVGAGGVITALGNLLAHLLRAEGRSGQAGLGVAMGGLLNIALDPLFMLVILPKGMEPLAVAVATTLSNLLAALYFLWAVYRRRQTTVLRLAPTRQALKNGIPGKVLAIGLPACAMTLFENISYAMMDKLLSAFGTAVQAGVGVAKKINMLAHCIVRGMAQGVLPLISYSFGAQNQKRLRDCVCLSCLISVGLATVCMLASLLLSHELVAVFIHSGAAAEAYGADCLRILCLGGPFSACAYAFISFFQAVGEGKRSFLLAILRKGVLDIPLMFLLGRLAPLYGVVWATPAADVLCCLCSLRMAAPYLRRQMALVNAGPAGRQESSPGGEKRPLPVRLRLAGRQ